MNRFSIYSCSVLRYLDDEELVSSVKVNIETDMDGDFLCTLYLDSVTLEDNGVITAVAINSEGKDKTAARLFVKG